jgi:hypothetical protein
MLVALEKLHQLRIISPNYPSQKLLIQHLLATIAVRGKGKKIKVRKIRKKVEGRRKKQR